MIVDLPNSISSTFLTLVSASSLCPIIDIEPRKEGAKDIYFPLRDQPLSFPFTAAFSPVSTGSSIVNLGLFLPLPPDAFTMISLSGEPFAELLNK